MPRYITPELPELEPPPPKTAVLIASGDLRQSANEVCWPAQRELEAQAVAAFEELGWNLVRHDAERIERGQLAHGFIDSQARGREVFAEIHPDTPLVVAQAAWQYSHHVLIGLTRHRGPILVLANWSGKWPGLVGALNLRGSLAKAGVKHAFLWGEDFTSSAFHEQLATWMCDGTIEHDQSHARALDLRTLPDTERALGEALAAGLKHRPAIMGVFDEGCMGMFNAIIPDHLLNPTGVFKERLSQSALYFAMTQVPIEEALETKAWLDEQGMRFDTGADEATELTDAQIHQQLKMYIAAVRLADAFGCDAIGIQYQQGLRDLCPASDLAEGLLNCSLRPPVKAVSGPRAGAVIRQGEPITHFNEVDECAGLDGLITHRVWRAMGMQPDNTLHDLRWGDWWEHSLPVVPRMSDQEQRDVSSESRPTQSPQTWVWVFEISGAVPPTHFENGYASATSVRQPPIYFRLGGGTISGVSRPGQVVWSRIFIEDDRLHMDIGRCAAIALPEAETRRRLECTTPQWPIMHAVTFGVSRDQMMARHRANHIQVVYADDAESADRA
ncbi:MAG: fucose isomerase, partial [Planctomycetes bacterium]|nr:fucose isomerase [Planctomycetota bacterium]